jgi:type IV pilus assembly protein PilB
MYETCGSRPLLGSVLVEQGVVEPDDLEEAVQAQPGSGERLGELLVSRGLICRPELDRAIATQSGVDLVEEAGFGSGLRAAIERRHRYRRDFAIS